MVIFHPYPVSLQTYIEQNRMSTFLFSELVFGPVKSRRLGISLGINLLPVDRKVCNYNCIYCECGWTLDMKKKSLPKASEVLYALEERLKDMHKKQEKPDVLTFAGNGEPTMHPQFIEIVEGVTRLRSEYCPEAKVAVLSNATLSGKSSVIEALKKVDDIILKLDSAFPETLQLLNQPVNNTVTPDKIIENLLHYKGLFILQTLFLKGQFEGKIIDNTTDDEVDAWLKVVEQTQPRKVMIYTLNRDTPAKGLIKLTQAELEKIAQKVRNLGFEVQVSA
jgi:wyosine [tRNA(Phe)-imidazoG37] synthetase (radical SAM superfamily)